MIIEDIDRKYKELNKEDREKADQFLLENIGNIESDAAKNSTLAIFLLGALYSGYSLPVFNYEKAFVYFQQAADAGHTEAQKALGDCYFFGRGCAKNYESSLYWYQKAADAGNPQGMYGVGRIYEDGKGVERDYQKAAFWIKKSAECEDGEGLCGLGWLYEYGYGVEKNDDLAVEFFKRSIGQKYGGGYCCLGYMYQFGRGVQKSYENAVDCYKKSAKLGNAGGQCRLAWMYKYGIGVTQNYGKAIKLFQYATAQGNIDAIYCLGTMYYDAYGVKRDYDLAKKYFELAAEEGNVFAINGLANCYLNGYGVLRDDNIAFQLYQEAANKLLPVAIFNLAQCYKNGRGVDKNYKKALELYEVVILNKRTDTELCGKAYYSLADLYEGNYYGIYENLFKAKEYYDRAKQYGYECDAEIEAVESRLNIGMVRTNKMGAFSRQIIEKDLPLQALFPEIEKKLKEEFGDSWGRLQASSRECIITGCLSYIALFSTGEETYKTMDFSSAIVPLSKACEIEFGRFFFDKFLAYLKKNNVPPTDFVPSENKFVVANVAKKSKMEQYDQDEDYLYFRQRRGGNGSATVHYVDENATGVYTLGGFRHYADIDRREVSMPIFEKSGINGQPKYKSGPKRFEIVVNKHMLAFAEEIFTEKAFPQPGRTDKIKKYLYDFANRTGDMANKLRNPAAHGDIMPYWKAVYCGNLIVMVEKFLKNFIEKIKSEVLL